MGLETAGYLSNLNTANPGGSDVKGQGDDHIRMMKQTLQNTFPGVAFPIGFVNFGGAANAYTATLSPAPAGYVNGMLVWGRVPAAATNTGASTLNVNGLGAVAIKKLHDVALVGGEMEANGMAMLVYNGNDSTFELLTNALASTDTFFAATTDTLLFYQAAAPAGWSEFGGLDDHALRVVTVASGLGGAAVANTYGVSQVWGSGKVANADGVHWHAKGTLATQASAAQTTTPGGSSAVSTAAHTHGITGVTASSTSHTHAIDEFDLKYAAFILCQWGG